MSGVIFSAFGLVMFMFGCLGGGGGDDGGGGSWKVLNDYGNMLSPSVMFVLELIMNDHKAARANGAAGFKQGIAFSFSPGVGAEGILLKVLIFNPNSDPAPWTLIQPQTRSKKYAVADSLLPRHHPRIPHDARTF